MLLDPRGDIPCVGASGGISGFIPLLFRIPVALAFALWVGLQSLLAMLQSSGLTEVSAYAHLGGAGTGIVCWALMRRKR